MIEKIEPWIKGKRVLILGFGREGQSTWRVLRKLGDFSAFTLTENLTNADLKKIIDKIVVKSKEEIYVYFKIGGEYDEVFTVPVRLTETVETDTNVEHGTQGHFRTAAPF